VVIEFLMILQPAHKGLRHGAASSRMQVPRLLSLAAGTAVFGVLAMWTREWDGAAMENWSRGGAPLTLAQLVNCAGFWEAISGRLLTLFVLTSPALYLLAVEGARRNGRNTLRSS
jgi:hypothetical protein